MTKTISVGLIGSEEDVAVKAGAAGPFALTVLKKDEYQVTDFGSVVELAAAYRAEGIAFKWAGPVERGFTRDEQAEFDDLVVIDEEVRSPRYAIVQAGYVGRERYASRDEAQAECDRLNRDASAEVGEDVIGDGAASVIDTEVDEA